MAWGKREQARLYECGRNRNVRLNRFKSLEYKLFLWLPNEEHCPIRVILWHHVRIGMKRHF